LRAFDDFLSQDIAVDYVGNRLHGGIRAMQKLRRTIIIEIDNRAREMSRDFKLPTIARHDFDRLAQMIDTPFVNETTPPFAAARSWLAQFTPTLSGPNKH
jgi:polysaccharide pyruvyl transferase WcaK-like protein